MLDVLLCGAKFEQAVGADTFSKGATGGHSHHAVDQIELDRLGKGVMHVLPGPRYAPCP